MARESAKESLNNSQVEANAISKHLSVEIKCCSESTFSQRFSLCFSTLNAIYTERNAQQTSNTILNSAPKL